MPPSKISQFHNLRVEWLRGYEQGRRDEFDAVQRLGLAHYDRVFLKLGYIGLSLAWALSMKECRDAIYQGGYSGHAYGDFEDKWLGT